MRCAVSVRAPSDMHAASQVHRRATFLFGGKLEGLANRLSVSSRFHRCLSRSSQRQSPRELLRDRFASLVVEAKGGRSLQELELRREPQVDQIPVVGKIGWESPLRVLEYPDPRLRITNARVGVFDDSLRQLAEEMFQIMYKDDGVGLAAPQVGVNLRLMVFNQTGDRERKDMEMVLVNPMLLRSNSTQDVLEEGCLSFPNIFADVWRPTKVEVIAQNLSGSRIKRSLSGFPARVFQHEYDHLQGTLFHDRMEPAVLRSIRDNLVALEEAYLMQHPGVDIRRV